MILLLFIDRLLNNISLINKIKPLNENGNENTIIKQIIIICGIVSLIYLLIYSINNIENSYINVKLYNNLLITLIIIDLILTSFFLCNYLINIGIYKIESIFFI